MQYFGSTQIVNVNQISPSGEGCPQQFPKSAVDTHSTTMAGNYFFVQNSGINLISFPFQTCLNATNLLSHVLT